MYYTRNILGLFQRSYSIYSRMAVSTEWGIPPGLFFFPGQASQFCGIWVVFIDRGSQNAPQYILILIVRTPKRSLIFWKPPFWNTKCVGSSYLCQLEPQVVTGRRIGESQSVDGRWTAYIEVRRPFLYVYRKDPCDDMVFT